ncbi:MAG TPA: tetratricopeptide repeat protein, partial [Sedimentisphaerales bacterium]|nr:tetratricopeptide repeat protein [Sedimentisphaerales bacterium]
LDLKCGWVRYEVTPNDTPDSIMALMMDNAFDAAQVVEGSFEKTDWRRGQWKALLNVVKIGDLVESMRRDPARNTREQFLERLRLISERMPDSGRAIFVIDPEKYMRKDSDQDWAIVVRDLPDKVKFVFAQRPEDVLVASEAFKALENVVGIPEANLVELDRQGVDELVRLRVGDVEYNEKELREGLERYEGYPYALGAAIELIKAGTAIENLPRDPGGIAAAQWKKLAKRGKEAIRLFKAYAILDVGVPDEVVEAVSKVGGDSRQSLMADGFLAGLVRGEGYGFRIYHAILADYVLEQIGEEEKKEYHSRAVGVYREKLKEAEEKQTKPDELSAVRLAEHVLAAEGEKAFIEAFVYECGQPLMNLGLVDAAMGLSERGLGVVEKGTEWEAMLRGILGLIYKMRGELETAEEMHFRSLEIGEELGRLDGVAGQYGNLALIHQAKGEMEKAEEMHLAALQICESNGFFTLMVHELSYLGDLAMEMGELEKAQNVYLRALSMAEDVGAKEEMAMQYQGLGGVYRLRGEWDRAETAFLKAMGIEEELGDITGVAASQGNLSLIYMYQGQLEKADKLCREALETNKGLQRLEGIAAQYGNLGLICVAKGDLDKAEEMYKQSLAISKTNGFVHLTIRQCEYLGSLYRERGDKAKARECWTEASGLCKKIGMPHMVEVLEAWIKGLE